MTITANEQIYVYFNTENLVNVISRLLWSRVKYANFTVTLFSSIYSWFTLSTLAICPPVDLSCQSKVRFSFFRENKQKEIETVI